MTASLVGRRHHPQLALEPLDRRLVCSGLSVPVASPVSAPSQPLQVEMVTPVINRMTVPGTSASTSEPAFALRFDDSIDPFLLGGNDFRIDQSNQDGSTTKLATNQGTINELADPADPSGHTVLVSVTEPLAQGTYRLVLVGASSLVGTDGRPASQISQELNLFQVGPSPSGTIPAITASTIDSTTTNLYFPVGSDQDDAPLNQITLAPGLAWTFSSKFNDLNPDAFGFRLFNDAQQLVTSGTGSELGDLTGRMTPGTYYLQIDRSTPDTTSAAGSLEVTVAATPVSGMIPGVRSLQLLNFNRTSLNPDTVEVQFAGSNLPPTLLDPSAALYSVTNGQGQVWKITATAVDSTTNTLTLLFPSYLPTGHYSVQVSFGGAGSTASAGTLLGSFDTELHPLVSNDLGTAFPMSDGVVEFKNSTQLAPGQATTQFVSIVRAGHYQINLSNPLVSSELVRVNRANAAAGDAIIEGPVDPAGVLDPGEYAIIASNHSSASQEVAFHVLPALSSSESLSLGGVGQMPATGGTIGLIGVAPAAPLPSMVLPPAVASEPSHAVVDHASMTSIPVGSTGSFSLKSFDQAPIGSLATRNLESGQPAATSTLVAVALNSTMVLSPRGGLGKLAEARVSAQPGALESPSELVSAPPAAAIPSEQDVPIVLARFGLRPPLTEPGRSQLSPENPSTLPASEVIVDAALAGLVDRGDQSRPNDQPSLDPMPESIEYAGLASPLGVLLAGCMLYRRIKLARVDRSSGGSPIGRVQARHWSVRSRRFAATLDQTHLI